MAFSTDLRFHPLTFILRKQTALRIYVSNKQQQTSFFTFVYPQPFLLHIFIFTLQSILISFIIGIIYSVLETLLKFIIPNSFQFLENTTVKQAGYLLLGVIFGLFFIKLPKTKIGVFTLKVFNRNLSPEPSVWLKAMENNNGAWATIYLENGLIYTGMLINYTSDSNDEKKEVLLSNYRLSVRNQSTAKGSENFCTVIEDYTDNANAKVFLSQNVIVAIEIIN